MVMSLKDGVPWPSDQVTPDRSPLDQPFLATGTVPGQTLFSDSEQQVTDRAACYDRRSHGVKVGMGERVQSIFVHFPPG